RYYNYPGVANQPRIFARLSARTTSDGARQDEVAVDRLSAAVGRADEDPTGDPSEVVDHVAVDEAGCAPVVRTHGRPARRMLRRDDAVVDRRPLRAAVVHDEVPRADEPGERRVVVPPELVAAAARAAEPLLEERERGKRVLTLVDDLIERREVRRDEIA